MGRPLEKSKALFREVKQGRRTLNHIARELTCVMDKNNIKKQQHGNMDSTYWVPHPRNGIYYPKGHELVMEDVPKGAASFQQTYWLRSLEGVDDKETCPSSTNGIFAHPFLDM